MPDWTKSMQQTFEYYIVDPGTWKDSSRISTVKTSTIDRDSEVETLGSATMDITESLGECYVRTYLITIQNGIREKHPLGTFLVQTPSSSFDGRVQNLSIDAYTPLIELKENSPNIGYYIPKGENVLDIAYQITRDHVRAPVVKTENSTKNYSDYVADTADSWLTFLSDFIGNHTYERTSSNDAPTTYQFDLDEMGRILFSPKQDLSALQPVWTYDDGNSSILYPEVSLERDLYGIPNVVEVVYSSATANYHVRVVNDDPNSPVSTVSRGREIIYRDLSPLITGDPTKAQVESYAKKILQNMSTVKCTISYTHGYCPVRLGDCVRLNYARAGLIDIKAKVISQSIKCEPGCPVTEKAVFTKNLWR